MIAKIIVTIYVRVIPICLKKKKLSEFVATVIGIELLMQIQISSKANISGFPDPEQKLFCKYLVHLISRNK
jgi:hypothetical protein